MKSKKLLTIFTIVLVFLIAGCKKDKNPENPNTSGMPLQTTVQQKVSLEGASNFAIIAFSAVTNTGARLDGQALARTGAVNMAGNIIVK